MTGLLCLHSLHYCAALSSGDRGQRANVWLLAHVHRHCIESRPQERRRCRWCSTEAIQRGINTTHQKKTKKKKQGLIRSDWRYKKVFTLAQSPTTKRFSRSGCDVSAVVCFRSFMVHGCTIRCCSQNSRKLLRDSTRQRLNIWKMAPGLWI